MITGATNGIGKETALAIAAMGAETYLVCRNPDKAEQTKSEIITQTGNHQINLLIGDLSSLSEVSAVAASFLQLKKPLHLLINNAGIVNLKREITVDGFEEMFAVNHLAHFLLTHLLLDTLKNSAPSRIVNVSSEAHIFYKRINFNDLSFETGFGSMKVYGHSKLANILFTRELAKKLEGTDVTANALHPGTISTGLGTQNGWIGKAIMTGLRPFLKSPQQGAKTTIYTSVSPELDGISGKYFENCKEKQPKPWAQDDDAAAMLWKVSSRMTGLVEAN